MIKRGGFKYVYVPTKINFKTNLYESRGKYGYINLIMYTTKITLVIGIDFPNSNLSGQIFVKRQAGGIFII